MIAQALIYHKTCTIYIQGAGAVLDFKIDSAIRIFVENPKRKMPIFMPIEIKSQN